MIFVIEIVFVLWKFELVNLFDELLNDDEIWFCEGGIKSCVVFVMFMDVLVINVVCGVILDEFFIIFIFCFCLSFICVCGLINVYKIGLNILDNIVIMMEIMWVVRVFLLDLNKGI